MQQCWSAATVLKCAQAITKAYKLKMNDVKTFTTICESVFENLKTGDNIIYSYEVYSNLHFTLCTVKNIPHIL